MKTTRLAVMILALAGGALLTAGCVYDGPRAATVGVEGEVYVSGPPPPPVEETVTVSPGVGFVWVPGGYVWGGNRWAWHGGRWERPPHAGAVWVPHRYENRGGRHVWVRGGWR